MPTILSTCEDEGMLRLTVRNTDKPHEAPVVKIVPMADVLQKLFTPEEIRRIAELIK